ncbi:MAG: sugar transferase [Ruminococcus sp.]|nr:sugar transferase [Ruminococcus sp.]
MTAFIVAVSAISAGFAFVAERIEEIKNKGKKFIHKPYGIYERFIKRPLDCFLSTGALMVLSPVMLFLTVFGAFKMKGNPFFTQKRPGRIDPETGRETVFNLIKFKSMTDEKDENGRLLPDDVRLTSFSVLMARFKGFLDEAVKGAYAIDDLKDNSMVLISEGCTHHRQCNDIGTVKLPKWLMNYTGKTLRFETTSGTEFPETLDGFDLVIHCGGCMLNEREMKYRMKTAADLGVPMTNYGTAIAHMNGILERSLLGGKLLKNE